LNTAVTVEREDMGRRRVGGAVKRNSATLRSRMLQHTPVRRAVDLNWRPLIPFLNIGCKFRCYGIVTVLNTPLSEIG
jgi:hypothetical protein